MAYESDIRPPVVDGNEHLYTILETDAAAGSETDAIDVPVKGRIVGYTVRLIGGGGTTVAPRVGRDKGFTADTEDEVAALPGNGVPAAFIDEQSPAAYYAPEGKLYIRSGVDADTDNVIRTEIKILANWGP